MKQLTPVFATRAIIEIEAKQIYRMCGGCGTRTRDLLLAKQTLYQLS